MRLRFWTVLWSVLVCLPAWGQENRDLWKLAWEDDFNRTEVGDGWFQWMGQAEIVDGRLYLSGNNATLLTERTFQPDVMVEFTAEADPDKPPCDLSAAVVESTSSERLRIRLYNFNETTTRMGLRPWQLTPGLYVLNSGEAIPGEGSLPERYQWRPSTDVQHLHRGVPVWIEVPSHKEWIVDLRLKKAIQHPALLPDLAIGQCDLRLKDDKLVATVHNIGGAEAASFKVNLESRQNGQWSLLAGKRIEELPAISNFNPVRYNVEFQIPADKRAGELRVVLDADNEIEEIYELNNIVTITKR